MTNSMNNLLKSIEKANTKVSINSRFGSVEIDLTKENIPFSFSGLFGENVNNTIKNLSIQDSIPERIAALCGHMEAISKYTGLTLISD